MLRINSGTRSEEVIPIVFNELKSPHIKGSFVEIVGWVKTTGPLARCKITADKSQMTAITRKYLKAEQLGGWVGEPRQGKCP